MKLDDQRKQIEALKAQLRTLAEEKRALTERLATLKKTGAVGHHFPALTCAPPSFIG